MKILKNQIQEAFTVSGAGTTPVVLLVSAPGHHSLQVFGVGGSPTAWDIRLQGSLDGTHWFDILTHSSAGGDGLNDIKFSQGNFYKVSYLRVVCNAVTLSGATSINAIADSD